jgi:D-amino peptidase
MMQGIDASFDGVFFLGYHARSGTPEAILDHTWSSRAVANLWLNGILTGEYGLNAAVAGHFGVPVVMVSGDQSACSQVRELLGDVDAAIVKRALGRFSADCLSTSAAHEVISLAASRAVERLGAGTAPRPFVLDSPVKVRIEFFASHMADRAALLPGAARDGVFLEFEAGDVVRAHRGFRAAVALAGE